MTYILYEILQEKIFLYFPYIDSMKIWVSNYTVFPFEGH